MCYELSTAAVTQILRVFETMREKNREIKRMVQRMLLRSAADDQPLQLPKDISFPIRYPEQMEAFDKLLGDQTILSSVDMKIYFCGSIYGGRQDAELYTRLIDQLKGYGTVLTEHVGSKELTDEQKKWTDKNIHDNSLEWLTSCDVVVAEVTQPSLGVGYEIGRAIAMNKKILCLFRPSSDKRLSAMISGADNGSTVQAKHYTEQEAAKIFKDFFT